MTLLKREYDLHNPVSMMPMMCLPVNTIMRICKNEIADVNEEKLNHER